MTKLSRRQIKALREETEWQRKLMETRHEQKNGAVEVPRVQQGSEAGRGEQLCDVGGRAKLSVR